MESRLLLIQYRLRVLPSQDGMACKSVSAVVWRQAILWFLWLLRALKAVKRKKKVHHFWTRTGTSVVWFSRCFQQRFVILLNPQRFFQRPTSLCLTAFQPFDMQNKYRNGEACVENYDKPRTFRNRSCERQFWRERTWKQCKCKFSVLWTWFHQA